ncbi:MAG: DUF5591 domain-containing protein, partial [Promethearchaeota archaeon]
QNRVALNINSSKHIPADYNIIYRNNTNSYRNIPNMDDAGSDQGERALSLEIEGYIDHEYLKEYPNILTVVKNNCPLFGLSMDSELEIINNFKSNLIAELMPLNEESEFEIGIEFSFNNELNLEEISKSIIEFINEPIIRKRTKLVVLKNLFDNLMNFRSIINAFLEIRNNIPADILIMVSGKISPILYPLLVYIGVDLIDAYYLLYAGTLNLYYSENEPNSGFKRLRYHDHDDHLHLKDELDCFCPICKELAHFNIGENGFDMGTKFNLLLGLHNLYTGLNKIKAIKNAVKEGVLRNYVERSSVRNMFIMSSLRYLDTLNPNPIVPIQRLDKSNKVICPGPLSYNNPEIVRYRHRLLENYVPRSDTPICVLLPCSMTKPYSKSRSHKGFLRAIRKGSGKLFKKITQLIITSPLGVVPRELEKVYPAAHYDISVTGEWDYEEEEITAYLLGKILQKLGQNVPIIAHLEGGYRESFVKAIKKYNIKNNYFISTNLDDLEKLVKENLNGPTILGDPVAKKDKDDSTFSAEEWELKTIVDYQFGLGTGELLIGNAARFVQSRNELYKEIYGYEAYGKVYLGRFNNKNGVIELSLQGAQRLFENGYNKNLLRVNMDKLEGSTIFPPILDALDRDLVAGDQVIIVNKSGKFYGLGKMIVNAETALRIRHGSIAAIKRRKNK